ncbi:hypothetical protein [Methanolapillus ohkumae]|uniref:Uncharacterized protein n=1 Tax=Methanolapillus ohkumae TaxID=3028298 RepID=A0AA97A5G1_9EURY|nr:hypothetical protein MsAm2_02910 [Methanosarcinaceae archaeon Am2]
MVNLKRFHSDGTRRYYLTDVCMALFCGISVLFGAVFMFAAEVKHFTLIHPAMIISEFRYLISEIGFLTRFLIQTTSRFPLLKTILTDFYVLSSNTLRFGYRSIRYGNIFFRKHTKSIGGKDFLK